MTCLHWGPLYSICWEITNSFVFNSLNHCHSVATRGQCCIMEFSDGDPIKTLSFWKKKIFLQVYSYDTWWSCCRVDKIMAPQLYGMTSVWKSNLPWQNQYQCLLCDCGVHSPLWLRMLATNASPTVPGLFKTVNWIKGDSIGWGWERKVKTCIWRDRELRRRTKAWNKSRLSIFIYLSFSPHFRGPYVSHVRTTTWALPPPWQPDNWNSLQPTTGLSPGGRK